MCQCRVMTGVVLGQGKNASLFQQPPVPIMAAIKKTLRYSSGFFDKRT